MKSKKNWTRLLLAILSTLPLMWLAPSCSPLAKQADTAYSKSALYDPPCIHLIGGKEYQVVEGTLVGRGQIFYSDPTYRTALQLGRESQWKPITPVK